MWLLFASTAVLLYPFTIGARPFQRWLRDRRPRDLGLQVIPAALFRESNLWVMWVIGIIPAIMFAAGVMGVICFFRGLG